MLTQITPSRSSTNQGTTFEWSDPPNRWSGFICFMAGEGYQLLRWTLTRMRGNRLARSFYIYVHSLNLLAVATLDALER